MDAWLTAAAKAVQLLLERWLALQEMASRHMANAGNIIQRMPALNNKDSFSELEGGLELRPLLLAKQMRSFEQVLGRLQAVMREMEEVVANQEKQCVNGWAALGAAATSGASSGKRVGQPSVTVMQAIESMEDVWYMCRDELCLKAALLSQLHHGTDVSEFAALNNLFSAHLHLKLESMPVVLLRNSV